MVACLALFLQLYCKEVYRYPHLLYFHMSGSLTKNENKKIVLSLLSVFCLFCSCSPTKYNGHTSRKIEYIIYVDEIHRKIKYHFNVPDGYQIKNVTGTHESEMRIEYPDSSVIYITDDIKSGSALNYDNVSASPGHAFSDMLLKDSLVISGIQPNKRIWKQCKLKNIVIGYFNVLPLKKAEYEQVLRTINRIR